MVTLFMTLMIAIVLLSKPPLQALKPHLPRPAPRVQPVATHLVSSPSDLAANPTLALAGKDQAASAILYHRVAARSLGEGSFAVAEIACTVKNRLTVSGAPLDRVLRAYRARDVQPQPVHIELVRQVFEGELPCPTTWWYALGLQDTRHWKPHPEPAIVIQGSNHAQIWIFHR